MSTGLSIGTAEGLGLLAGLLLGAPCLGDEPPPPILPAPTTLIMESGRVAVTPDSRVIYDDPSTEGAVQLFGDDLRRVFGLAPAVVRGTTPGPGDILLRLIADETLDVEGYRIAVTDHVVIEASGIDGLLAGSVSLLQCMSPREGKLELPRMTIEDEPSSSLRALMVDIKNHWHPVRDLEQFIDLCRLYKVRYLSLHTGESQWIGAVMASTAGIPASTRASRRLYTEAEMGGLIAYAKARGVRLLPHNETTANFPTMRLALQTDFNPSDAYPNWIQEAYADNGIIVSRDDPEGLDGYVDTARNGVDGHDPDYWKAIELFTKRSFAQFAAGYTGDELPYYHMGPVQGEGGTHPNNAVKLLDILREVDANVKLLFWNGPNATSGHDLLKRKSETVVCFYSKQFSASDIGAYLRNDWPVLNAAWSPLYIVGEGVARTQRQVHDDWNTFRTGTDGFTGTGFEYGAIDWEDFDSPSSRSLVTGGMLCTWEVPTWVHLDRVRGRLPAFAEHAWHHRTWPYPAVDYEDFLARYVAVDRLVPAFLGLTPTRPTVPKGLKASNGTVADAIQLTWQGSAGFPDGYRVLRNNTNNLSGAVRVSGDLFEEFYLDTDIVVNTPYYYWVRAFNEVGESKPTASTMGSAGDGIARTEIYEPFSYAAGEGIHGKDGGEGWKGAWSLVSANGTIEIASSSLTYDSLPVSGGALRVHPATDTPDIKIERDMAEDMGGGGTTLWLSFLVRGDPVAIGDVFVIPNKALSGAVGKAWGPPFGFYTDRAPAKMASGETYFVVVRYDFKAGTDDLHLWINPPLSSEPKRESADKRTSSVDLGAGNSFELQFQGYGQGDYLLDEFRMGDSWEYAIGYGLVSDPDDLVKPIPDPMAWNVPPQPRDANAITMLAATATDSSGVEYFFEEVGGQPGGSDSGWQDSPAYTDGDLQPNTTYTYRVRSRDRSPQQNRTDWSSSLSATTEP